MTRVVLQLPDSVHERAKRLAKRDGISLDQWMASTVVEKVSGLEGIENLRARAAKGNREDLKRILAKIPARKPLKGDEFPTHK